MPTRSAASAPRAACGLAGLAVCGLLGGVVGLGLGVAVALLGPRLLARLDVTESDAAELTAVLPLALDLLAACLAGGAVPIDAVSAVAAAFPGPCGSRLQRVASALALGSTPAEAWAALGSGRDAAGAAARALARAAEGGAPVADAVQRVAAEARRRKLAQAHRRAARAGVLAVLPLGVCFLPAFVLLGVVPAVVGLAGPLLASLS
ncbi:MAG: type II secretion system F family protein [Mycobacteriales bacterium]